MRISKNIIVILTLLCSLPAGAQDNGLVNTSHSAHVKLSNVDMGDVRWTRGFWAERFQVCKDAMVPNLWRIMKDPGISHAFKNFEIAARLDTGRHHGPPFHDGDFYKWLESVARVYAVDKDPKLDRLMDTIISVIVRAQRADGYIHTPVIIAQHKQHDSVTAFQDRLNFETYNMGHLMTTACVHYRATGKRTLLEVAIKAADYLYNFYKRSSPELARNAICPSHYMGVIEMYRTTRDTRYLELAKSLIDIRGLVESGTDDNQDRVPFRQQTTAKGHAVRANYLYAGAADVYAETGDDSLFRSLNLIWEDVTQKKLYITGACGALYDGVSPDGTSYKPVEVQKVHQAYGRDYQLPNLTAHSESCANIGNLLWNWRMLQLTGKAQYADIMELTLYNSILSSISLDGTKYLYANPLAVADKLPFQLRWSKDRVDYIGKSFCCPPNVVRTIAEVGDYLYSLSADGLWINLYGGNQLSTTLKNGEKVKLSQETDYPWDGRIRIKLSAAGKEAFAIHLRIPGWCKKPEVRLNGEPVNANVLPGEYLKLDRKWTAGDEIVLNFPMPVQLMEANPLVEEARNQVAVKRGPVVYCIESTDMSAGKSIFDLSLPASKRLHPKPLKIGNTEVMCLEGEARLLRDTGWSGRLYQEVPTEAPVPVHVRLIPYYAWGNRGHTEMLVWLPVSR